MVGSSVWELCFSFVFIYFTVYSSSTSLFIYFHVVFPYYKVSFEISRWEYGLKHGGWLVG